MTIHTDPSLLDMASAVEVLSACSVSVMDRPPA
jgi:hypothetical protein